MSYTIGSFNLYKFSGQHDQEIAKDIKEIANIIVSEKFDVIALQEMQASNNPKNLIMNRLLLTALGSNWDMTGASSDSPAFHSYSEGYVFLWNKSRLRLVENSESRIFDGYGVKSKLVRPPLTARFTPQGLPGGSFFELRLINIHLAFGKPALSPIVSDVEYRRAELHAIAEEVYPRIADKRYGNNMPSYTIIMGDYNLCIFGDSKILPRNDSMMSGFVDIPITASRTLRTLQSEKTTLKQVKPKESNSAQPRDADIESSSADIIDNSLSATFYSQDYDHFSLDTDTLSKLGIEVSRVDALEKYYHGSLERYRREISDHVPIKLILDLKRGN